MNRISREFYGDLSGNRSTMAARVGVPRELSVYLEAFLTVVDRDVITKAGK